MVAPPPAAGAIPPPPMWIAGELRRPLICESNAPFNCRRTKLPIPINHFGGLAARPWYGARIADRHHHNLFGLETVSLCKAISTH